MAEIELDNLEEQQEVPVEDNVSPDNPKESENPGNTEASENPEDSEDLSSGKKLMRSLVSDDDEDNELTIDGIRQMLDAAPRWFLSQWKMLLLVLAGIFLYITNGYQAQVEMTKETELEAELKDWRYRSITRTSELTQLCRQSQLEQKLREQGDTTLAPSKVAPFIIKVKD